VGDIGAGLKDSITGIPGYIAEWIKKQFFPDLLP